MSVNRTNISFATEAVMNRPRVLLADDHRLLREAFARLLEPACDVVGAVADGRALLAAAFELLPDIVVIDIAMPLLNGLDAASQLKQVMPELKVIFLTVSEDPDLASQAFQAGASGYLLKNSAASELLQAIQEVAQGRSYVTPLATRGLVANFVQQVNSTRKTGELSPRRQRTVDNGLDALRAWWSVGPRSGCTPPEGAVRRAGKRGCTPMVD